MVVRDAVITRLDASDRLRPRRTFDEQLIARLPWLFRVAAPLGLALKPRWRIRRWLMARGVQSGMAAVNRQDVDLLLVRYAPDMEYEPDPEYRALGLVALERSDGSGRIAALFPDASESWKRVEFVPEWIVDFGDGMVGLLTFRAESLTSGINIEREYGAVIDFDRAGMIQRQRDVFDWEKALAMAGLDARHLAPRLREALKN